MKAKFVIDFINESLDSILDKISDEGMDSLTDDELRFLRGEEPEIGEKPEYQDNKKYNSIEEFRPNEIYYTVNGDKVRINWIDNGFVGFLLNGKITDMKKEETFLNFMNNGDHDLLEF